MPAVIPKISFPIPSNEKGQAFADSDALLDALVKESSGQYLVGSQGMWHGGIHITDATAPWCALSARTEAEQQHRPEPYTGAQFIRCMADGEIVAYRVDKEYPSIPWRDEKLYLSTSFVLVKHYVQPGENATSGLTFYTLYMNLAPFAAYAQQGGERERKTTDRLSYYRSAEDVQKGSGAKAGSLPVGVRVTLGDKLIAYDRRQFGEVTVTQEVKDAAGVTLNAGTAIWILCDRGNLKAESSVSSSPPPWWAKCSPAYITRPAGVVDCKTKRGWKYYLSSDDVLQDKKEGELTVDFPLSYEPGNATQQVVRPSDQHTFSLVTLGKDVGKQKKGDRVWVVSDGDSLTALTPAGSGEPKFGEVVLASPGVKINAGDGIGHMGFYQLPEENGKRARYQVHIECLSMDDTLPTFLTNPDKVGESTPAYLKYPEGAALFIKNAQGAMVDSTRKTRAPGIITLSKVPVVEKDGQPTHYQIHAEGGYLAAADVQKLSQYALGELGFVTLDKAPESFDLIDGVKHPDNVVKGILEQMYKAAEAETRTSHILNKYNYKRLLNKIDSNQDGHYSEQEYLQAIHNDSPSYRDALYRIIAKHGSEWYYGKDDPLWKNYLDTLTKDAPLWKTYTEAFIDKISWMKQVAGMGPAPWHLHPVVFLGAFFVKKNDGIKGKLTYDAEGNNIPNSQFYSRVIHWPGNDESGVTLGRGYDMGNRTELNIYQDMIAAGIDDVTARKISLARGYKGTAASTFVSNNKLDIGEITEEQQINLFNLIYPSYVTRAIANYNSWTSEVATAKHWDQLDPSIQEVLVDFVYQGFTKGPNPMLAGANNDKQQLINYIRNTPGISRYEAGRHRADYLERN